MDYPTDWPFDDPPNLATIISRPIIEDGDWIALVSHDEDDGGWQFLPSGDFGESDARIIGLGNIFIRDPSIGERADLPLGWRAWRDAPGSNWRRTPRG